MATDDTATAHMNMDVWQDHLVGVLEGKLQVEHYEFAVKAGAGPRLFVTLKGAEGDATAARLVRGALTSLLQPEVEKYDPSFQMRISSFNKDDDLVIRVEFTW